MIRLFNAREEHPVSASKAKKPVPPVQPAGKPVGRSLDDFKSNYDKSYIVPNKLRAALAKLDGGWLYEVDFAKLAGVNLADLAAFRSAFEDHVVVLNGNDRGKRVWAGTKAAAAKMREMIR